MIVEIAYKKLTVVYKNTEKSQTETFEKDIWVYTEISLEKTSAETV